MNSPKLIYTESTLFDPYYNLSLEKYLFDHVKEGEIIFYLWQNKKTIVCGRNQNVYKECNLSKAQNLGCKIARRESGGGAVFHDIGNLNFSFIARGDLYDVDKNLKVIETALSNFGLITSRTGRNDLTIDNKKFSGNAFHKVGDKYCHHGTIMVDVDISILSSLLNVNREKLESKGVESVESRVQNLHDLNELITVSSLKEELKKAALTIFNVPHFSELSTSLLTTLQGTSLNMAVFSSEEWIFGKSPSFTNVVEKRFEWGSIEFGFEVEKGLIKSARVFSDSLTPNFITEIEKAIQGIKYDASEINKAIDNVAKSCSEDIRKCHFDIKELLLSSI